MQLLGLLIYTIVFILAHGGMMYFFFRMIEPGGALDIIFSWQKLLDYTYGHKYRIVELIGKILGNCEMCTCFWLSFFSFFVYRWLALYLNLYTIDGWYVLIWAWVYWGLSAIYSFWFTRKLKDGL